MKIIKGEKFKKEFKKLLKKYYSLEKDLEVIIKYIEDQPTGDGSKNWPKLRESDDKVIMKKRMMCRAVRGASFRIIYYYDGKNIELEFIEIYFKGNKESEDKKRVKEIWEEKTNNQNSSCANQNNS